MRFFFTAPIAIASALWASSSLAQSVDQPKEERRSIGPIADAKIGGLAPLSGLQPGYRVGIGLGVIFPWLHRGLAFKVDLDYAAATADGSKDDPRLASGSYKWSLNQQYLTLMPVFMYRITTLKILTPFVGVGPRIYFMKSTVKGTAGGSTIDETNEQSTQIGVGVPFGAEFKLGPGGILAEFLFEIGPYDHTATGSTHTGAFGLSAGYRLAI